MCRFDRSQYRREQAVCFCQCARLCLLALLITLADSSTRRDRLVAAADEYKVKAAFIYNFAKFTAWPSEAFSKSNAPFVIGIVGKDPFGSTMDETLKNKSVEEHPVTIRRVKWGEAKECHLLFVSGSEGTKTRDMDPVKTSPILTVGETSGFAQRGGIINFTVNDEKVGFEINPDAAKRAKLDISSKLLSLAKIVK